MTGREALAGGLAILLILVWRQVAAELIERAHHRLATRLGLSLDAMPPVWSPDPCDPPGGFL